MRSIASEAADVVSLSQRPRFPYAESPYPPKFITGKSVAGGVNSGVTPEVNVVVSHVSSAFNAEKTGS